MMTCFLFPNDAVQVLEQDDTNVSVLVQRALLYESMEKYKLGAEDLRTVLKIDRSFFSSSSPVNHGASSSLLIALVPSSRFR